MNKKLLSGLALLGVLVGAGCAPKYDDTVLANAESLYVAHGQYKIGDLENGWDGKSDELYQASSLTATSVAAVAEYSVEIADALKTKDVKYLYSIDVTFGTNDAGWTTRVMKADGKKYEINGSYAFKVAKVSYDEEDKVYAETQWVSDPHTAHLESLTPSNFFVPTWVETPDENGFDWSQNPACIGGAGTYTLVFAEYNTISTAEAAGFGIGLYKKAEGTAATEDVEVVAYVADDHTYGLIGAYGGYNWDTDTDLTGSNGSYACTVELAVGDQVKVRADKDWTYSWGYAAVNSAPEGAFADNSGNIECKVAGTYTITISGFQDDASAKIDITAAA